MRSPTVASVVAFDPFPQALGVGLRDAGPVGELPRRGGPVEVEKALDRLVGGRDPTGLAEHVAALGVEPDPGPHGPVAPQHRGDVMALAPAAPGHQVGTDSLAELVVELVLAQCATAVQRPLRRLGYLRERVGGSEGFLGRQPLDLLTELGAELIVVGRDQGASVEREVLGCERVDRAPRDVGDDEIAAAGRLVVRLSREAGPARREREQGRVAGEVGGRARRGFGDASRLAAGEAGAGEPKREDLLSVHRGEANEQRSRVQTMRAALVSKMEAGGIEPPTRRCKRRVFPLAPRPQRHWSLGREIR